MFNKIMGRGILDLAQKKHPPHLGLKLGRIESESSTDERLRSHIYINGVLILYFIYKLFFKFRIVILLKFFVFLM